MSATDQQLEQLRATSLELNRRLTQLQAEIDAWDVDAHTAADEKGLERRIRPRVGELNRNAAEIKAELEIRRGAW